MVFLLLNPFIAALAAGIFHRNEVEIKDVKAYLASRDFNVRV
jgi:imidazole glycerol phosphate synthase subunit HisF